MRIAVFGASGFTGSLAVAQAHRRGFVPVLVGRNADRLHRTAEAAGLSDPEIRVATLDDIDSLTAAFADCDAIVNTAGPFTLWGEPVIRAALAARVHYVDTAGEQGYIHHVLETFGAAAQHAGITIVPAMADDGGPGDLIAALTTARLGAPVEDFLIADLRIPVPGGASRGTARSMAAILSGEALEYTDGAWHPAHGEPLAPLTPPGETSAIEIAAFALPGIATIPRHIPARRVRNAMRAETGDLFAALTPEVVDSIPEVPDLDARNASRWLMLAEATAADGTRARGWVTGTDGYRHTAVIAVEAARRLATGAAPAGALTPAQAFDPADFLGYLTAEGVDWAVQAPVIV
ncbi:saccharopine dehydrogenase family protein [Nocardia sp. NPDC020380]|uniref:saccharopine dehydrogenase family protein n=1 Tax=Nocardia sp. NPDC020380 TaxID=3364309 RepID=UPI0037BA1B1F